MPQTYPKMDAGKTVKNKPSNSKPGLRTAEESMQWKRAENASTSTINLFTFRRVFQDIPECRTALIHNLTGCDLTALRKAIGFWLSKKEKRVHASILPDVFRDMDWTKDVDEVIMIGRGLEFSQVEKLAWCQNYDLMPCQKMVPFMVMLRAPVSTPNLVPWVEQFLRVMRRSTSMRVTKEAKLTNGTSAPVAAINGFAAGAAIYIPITVLTLEWPRDQLARFTTDGAIIMSLFQPALRDVKWIMAANVESNELRYEKAGVITYKRQDTFRFIIRHRCQIKVSLMLSPGLAYPCDSLAEVLPVLIRVARNG